MASYHKKADRDLAKLVANRRWLRREHPFPHFWAADVFHEPAYRRMAEAFQSIRSRGQSESRDGERFARTIAGYDAYAVPLKPSLPEPLHVFMSRAWHDMLAALTGVRATGDLNGSLHHHAPGSLSGRPHNDLNPGYFAVPLKERAREVNLSDPQLCSYHTGHIGADAPAGTKVRETVRAAAMLFYLNNPPWTPGDGGETGLYDIERSRTDAPCLAVPPINNSLLVFECTPFSYHAFISNRRHERNSVVLWIHRERSEAVSRWGERSLVPWTDRPVLNESPT